MRLSLLLSLVNFNFFESDDSNTKQLFGKLFLALNEEIDGDSLIKNILGDE